MAGVCEDMAVRTSAINADSFNTPKITSPAMPVE
jgi:hypothetical protein